MTEAPPEFAETGELPILEALTIEWQEEFQLHLNSAWVPLPGRLQSVTE